MRAKLRAASMTDDTTRNHTDTETPAGHTRLGRRVGALVLSAGLFTFGGAMISAPAFADSAPAPAPAQSSDRGLIPELLERVLPILDPTDPPGDPTEPPDDPTESPSDDPTESPSEDPTESPSDDPTESPSEDPTGSPTGKPTIVDPSNVETIQRPENEQRKVDDPLPTTGVDAAMTAGAGAAMLGAGVVVLLMARRRRASGEEAPATATTKE